jgi:hypothetical protein
MVAMKKYIMKSTLKPFQKATLKWIEKRENIEGGGMLLSEAGTGKCHKIDTLILMFDGTIKKVQDILVGDFLMGDDSTPRKVQSLARGQDLMYDIIPVKGEKYTVNQEHILCLKISYTPSLRKEKQHVSKKEYWTIRWFEHNKYNTKSFSLDKVNEAKEFLKNVNHQDIMEIAVKDYINLNKSLKHDLKGYKVPVEFDEKPLNFDPYIIGFWLGDGDSNTCCITTQDSTVIKYCKTNLAQYKCYLQFHDKMKYRINGNGSGNNNCNIFLSELQEQNLINNKHIPDIYKCNSRENRLQLLAGLIDSDGSLDSSGCYDFIQKSEKLIDDVIYLCRSLGFACYKSKQKKGCWYLGEYKEDDYYRISISGNINEIPVLCPRKKANERKQIKDVLKTRIKVEEVGYDNYYGFMIDGNNRYIMGDFTVTHNTICILNTIVNNPVNTLIICPAGIIDNWCNEIEKHTSIDSLLVLKYYGPNRQNYTINIGKQVIYITSYSIIAREFTGKKFESESLINKVKFERIVLDEAHYIRNHRSNYFETVMKISEVQDTIRYRWVVTATPIFNKINDAYAYFNFLGLESIDDRGQWTTRISKDINGIKIVNKWFKKHAITFKKEQVLKEELSNKNETKIILKFSEPEQEFYNALKEYSLVRMKTLMKRIKNLHKTLIDDKETMKKLLRSNVMVYILRLKQCCDSPMLILDSMKRLKNVNTIKDAIDTLKFFNESKNQEEECPICYDTIANYIAKPCGHKCCGDCWDHMSNLNITSCPKCRSEIHEIINVNETETETETEPEPNITCIESTKINYLLDLTNKIVKKGEKIIIVSQWVSMLNIIRNTFTEANIKFISLQGDIQIKERSKYIKQFETDTKTKVCFISLMSSAEGINLVAANHLVLVDSWYNESKMIQVQDRIHRINQTRKVYIYNLQIENTIEQQIEKLVKKKSKITNLILNKWNIHDLKSYDSSWLTDVIKLIDKPPQESVQIV